GAIVLVADDAARQVLARKLAPLEIERVPVAVVRRAPEHRHALIVFQPSELAIVRDVAPYEVAPLPRPRRALGPERAGPQPLDRRVSLDIAVELRIDADDIGVGEVGRRRRVRSEVARR